MHRVLRAALAVLIMAAALAPQARAAPALDLYGALPAASNVKLSPSGERVAFVYRDDSGQKLIVTTADQKPVAMAPLEDARVSDLMWAGDDHLIIVTTVTMTWRNTTNIQTLQRAFHVDLRTGRTEALFNTSKFLTSAVFGFSGLAKVDGRWTAFVGAVDDTTAWTDIDGRVYRGLYSVDLESGRTNLVDRSQNGPKEWVVGADGQVRGYAHYLLRDRTWRLYPGLEAAAPILDTVVGPDDAAQLMGLGRRPGTLLVERISKGRDDILEVDASGATEVVASDENALTPLFDPIDGRLVGLNLGGGRVTLFDPALQRRYDAAAKAFPGLRVYLISYAAGFGRLALYTEGPGDSGTYWLVDIAAGSAKVLAETRPRIRAADVGDYRRIDYAAGDGLKLDAVLTLPHGAAAKGLPLLVLPHDGPMGAPDEPGFDWIAQAFAARGYAVLQPNYRGTLRRGEDFRLAAAGQLGRAMQTDLSDGVAYLAAQGIVDPAKVCIMGRGYGGYAALAGVTLQSGVYRCAVSVNGVSDIDTLVTDNGPNDGRDKRRLDFWRKLAGTEGGAAAQAISPVSNAERASAPILLIHAQDDTETPIWQGRNMARALSRAGKSTELIVLKDEDHRLSSTAGRRKMLEAAVAFVEAHNPAH